jgi:hypothetical protein|tara:strand:- start:2964 stop:3137 length:174 start_codon:yes stop_codon:yes gene_type:complete
MDREQIAQQMAEFEKRGGKIKRIERGYGTADQHGSPFNNRNRAKGGGRGISIRGEYR